MRVLAIVPARCGSKRLPGKNMKKLGGKTLIHRACDAAGSLDCVVTSDSMETLAHVSLLGKIALLRPDHLATDTATSADCVKHVLSVFPGYDAFILLQPTSPLRTAQDVAEAIQMFTDEMAPSLVSVSRGTKHPNGAIYIGRVHRFMESGLFCEGGTVHYEMPTERSIDVDTLEDFERCEDYLLGPRVVYADGHVGRQPMIPPHNPDWPARESA